MKTPHETLLVRQLLAPGMPTVSQVYQCGTPLVLTWHKGNHVVKLEVFEDGRAEWSYINVKTDERFWFDADANDPIDDATRFMLGYVTEKYKEAITA